MDRSQARHTTEGPDQARRSRRVQRVLLSSWTTALLIFTLLAAGSAQPAQAAEPPRVLPQLLEQATGGPEQSFRIIVQRRNKDSRADAAIAAGGYRKLKEVAGDGFVAEVRGKDIARFAQHPAIKYISIDARMRAAGTDDASVEAANLGTLYPRASAATHGWGAGLTGQGVGVAVVDTGITPRPDFQADASGTSRLVAQQTFNAATPNVADGYGHGTHVAGIVAGNSWWSDDAAVQGKYIGVAPRANLVNVKVADDQGGTYVSDVVNGIDWVIENRATHNIRVMNLSLVSSVAESYSTSMLCAAVERAWFSGILVVVAAGNAGVNTLAYPPANDPFVITVGASDSMGTDGQRDDTVAPWSSYGVSQDGISKPDVVAAGRYMVAPLASSGSVLAQQLPDRIVDQHYIRLSGTSMAAPVVAGIAALAFQQHPEWSNDQVKWLLMQTATGLGTTAGTIFMSYPGQGAGEVRADRVLSYGATPGFANQGVTISAQLVGPSGATTYATSSSWSSSSWSSSSWSSSSWSSSSWSSSSWSSSSWSSSSWSSSSWSSSSWSSSSWSNNPE